jgi:hypothetical protein
LIWNAWIIRVNVTVSSEYKLFSKAIPKKFPS